MKRRLLFVAVLLLVALVSYPTVSHARVAISPATFVLTCNSITVSGTSDSDHLFFFRVTDITTSSTIAEKEGETGSGFAPYSSTVAFSGSYAPGDSLDIFVSDGFSGEYGFEATIPPCGSSNAITWCQTYLNGDGRYDGRCNDRLAAYCNNTNPQSIGIIAIDDKGHGIQPGVTFSAHDLVNGAATKTLPNGQGVISAWYADGSWYFQWNGGKFGANGQGDFTKNGVPCKI